MGETNDSKSGDRILVISQYFYPEEFRINDICKEWVKRGHKVTVVTGIPNYPKGKFYKGYGWFQKRQEEFEGINIIRLPIISRGKNVVRLVLNYLSFVLSGMAWKIFTKEKFDKVFIYGLSPMTQALIGVEYAKKHKIPCYIYVLDLWPETVEIILDVHNKLFIGSIGKMVDYIYKHCDKVFASSQSFVNKIASRGISADKVVYWPQYAEDCYKKLDYAKTEIPQDGILNLTFAGNMGYSQGLDILERVAVLLKKKHEVVRFNLIGNGRYENVLKANIKEKNVEEYFKFIDKKPPADIPRYMANSDAALIILAKSDIFAMTIPAKMQSCLACGIPLVVSADGEVQQIVKEAKCGYAGNSGDADALAENILKMKRATAEERKEFADNALKYYIENFNKEYLLDKIEEYI